MYVMLNVISSTHWPYILRLALRSQLYIGRKRNRARRAKIKSVFYYITQSFSYSRNNTDIQNFIDVNNHLLAATKERGCILLHSSKK